MKQNIKKNYYKGLNSKIYRASYYDFMLFNGNVIDYNESYIDSITIADFSNLNIKDKKLFSDVNWYNAINKGVNLQNIGLTGVDNGLISFKKDRITNEEFLNLYLNSNLEIVSGDTRLFLTPITGNTLRYEYPLSLIENDNERYISYKGGFYQGFFKLYGSNYQVLPDKLDNDWVLHFELRPRTDYDLKCNIINNIHPENSGIFFFIGTRAENKFYEFYHKELKKNIRNNIIGEDYYHENIAPCGNYFADAYFQNSNNITNDEFIKNYTDSEGHKFDEWGVTEIKSDNKFLMFDRTPNGFTTKNWIEGTQVTLTKNLNYSIDNYFLLMNRTKTGYTTNTIEQYNKEKQYNYNLYKDIINNVFALRITDTGAIGYRYGILDCNSENNYRLIEEYSKDNIVKQNEWNSINVKCVKKYNNKMKLMFYVNGFLTFVSKDLPIFNFKELNDVQEKQEGVPYNISLGGGSLGLLETILPEYLTLCGNILPIERDFCGSFIGDIKSFKMFEGHIDYSSIKNYLS